MSLRNKVDKLGTSLQRFGDFYVRISVYKRRDDNEDVNDETESEEVGGLLVPAGPAVYGPQRPTLDEIWEAHREEFLRQQREEEEREERERRERQERRERERREQEERLRREEEERRRQRERERREAAKARRANQRRGRVQLNILVDEDDSSEIVF